MGLPSIFEVYSLAIGPSSLLTTGALRIGQAFRELLLSSPYRPHQRILIELLGNFSERGKENLSDIAVVCGLGGYLLEDSPVRLPVFFNRIRENGCFSFMGDFWPFNPESDVIFNRTSNDFTHPNTIRFHLVNPDGQPVFQAEYQSSGNGVIRGPGVKTFGRNSEMASPELFSEIRLILESEKISLIDYILSGECSRYRFTQDQVNKRMTATWKIMVGCLDHGLKTSGFLPCGTERQAMQIYKNYLRQIHNSPSLSPESARCGVYARAMAEEILDNRLIITAPTCSGAAIIPAAFKLIQENYMLSDAKITEGLWVAGLIGSMIEARASASGMNRSWKNEIAAGGLMASCGIAYLMGGTPGVIETTALFASELFAELPSSEKTMNTDGFIRINQAVAQCAVNLFDLARIQPSEHSGRLDQGISNLFIS
jgi:L-serine dehydratase